MTTQDEEKLLKLRQMREKREEKRRSKLRRKHRARIASLVAASILALTAFETIYSASAKEITITEIDEFRGVNESVTVRTRSDNIESALKEHGVSVGENDRLNVSADKPVRGNEDIVIKRGKRVKIKSGGNEAVVTVTKATAHDALVEAGYIPGEHDKITVNGIDAEGSAEITDGNVIELVEVSHVNEIITEKVDRGVVYIEDSSLPKGREVVMDSGADGLRDVTVDVTYYNGEEASRETVGTATRSEARNKIIAVGTAEEKPEESAEAKPNTAAENTASGGGTINGYKYKKKLNMTATSYTPSPEENGGSTVSAMGNPLGYGIAAVDPNVIPLGSRIYVTSADGSWVYGVASAEDTGGAVRGNTIDLCCSDLSNCFGKRDCVVYILE